MFFEVVDDLLFVVDEGGGDFFGFLFRFCFDFDDFRLWLAEDGPGGGAGGDEGEGAAEEHPFVGWVDDAPGDGGDGEFLSLFFPVEDDALPV